MTNAPIQIRNPDVIRDIRALAEQRGQLLTAVLAEIDALPKIGELLTDDDFYDSDGLPIQSTP